MSLYIVHFVIFFLQVAKHLITSLTTVATCSGLRVGGRGSFMGNRKEQAEGKKEPVRRMPNARRGLRQSLRWLRLSPPI